MTSSHTPYGTRRTPPCTARRLEASTAARWLAHTAGTDEDLRHWRTRVGYYGAVVAALGQGDAGNGDAGEIDIRRILRHHERGRPSTAYALAARHGLLLAYRATKGARAARTRRPPPRRSGRPARRGGEGVELLAGALGLGARAGRVLTGRSDAVAGPAMVHALAQSRAAQPALARAQDGLPPICAVEDLVILSRHALSGVRAARLLMDSMASGELEIPVNVPRPRCPALDDVLAGAAERIDTAVELVRDLPGSTVESGSAVALLRATASDLTNLYCDPRET